MTDARELSETTRRELQDVILSGTGETEGGEQGSLVWHGETVSDDIPPSLLSYFETSKSRAAVCERFILAELEDLAASHLTEDTMNLNRELDTDMMQLDMKVTRETENEEHPLTPKEAEALFSHIVSVCPESENEAETDEHFGREGDPEWEAKRSAREEEMKRSSESQRERRERRCREEKKTEERRRQTQRDFQEELNKLMEAEKLHQREVELMERRAQEKIEQEFLLQQELISNLQERVKEERRRREEEEEEQKRMKEEGEKKRKKEEEERKKEVEDRRKKEAETIKREMERRKMQEEMRRKKEDQEKRKIEEVKLREKHRRKKEEEQRRKKEEEQRRKEEEEKRREEEKEKRREEEKERAKREEDTNKIWEDARKREEERKRKEIQLKEEETRRRMEEEERKRKENEEKVDERERNRENEEVKVELLMAKKKMEEEKSRKNSEEIGLKEEIGNSVEEDERRGEEARITEELEVRVNEEEEVRISEEETRKVEAASMMEREEEENGETGEMTLEEEEKGLSVECKDKRKEDENTTKEGEQRKWQEEEMSRLKEEEEEKTTIQKEVMDWTEACEADGKVEHESKTKDDLIQREDGRKNIIAEVDTRKNTHENFKSEESKVKEEEERTNIRVRDTEEERRPGVQVKTGEKDGMESQNGSENTENTGNTGHSQLETAGAQNQPSPGRSPSESPASPTCSHAPQELDPNYATSVDAQDAGIDPCTFSSSSPACLPERTEQKRLSWMKECIPWSTLSLRNKSKQKGRVQSRRGPSRTAGPGSLPPLAPQTLLRSEGRKSLQEVTTVTLQDLPGCSLVTLGQCARLQSLTLRRCSIRSLEAVNQLPQLCHIDVQENDISFVDCENMSSLRVLRLGHNKLTSIHGLSGADNLDILDVSHNSISRIAGLESARRLQWLSLGHNQLISTKGLRDICTLLHLDCSHNHLARVEGLENSALLHTLDLKSNSLTEPPTLDNHVLLRELQLDDNSVSSLQGLALCWLPLLHRLSAAQNRITLLPSMSDFVSLASLDLRFNCMSELQNVCESAAGCQFLREVHLTGNPLQQESGWRSRLQKAAAGLRAIDGEETDSPPSAPAARRDGSASGSFLTFCRAQLEQTRDLQRRHRRELSNASSPLDALKSSCQHFSETLKLAVDQRFAHEYGDTDASAGQTTPEEAVDMDGASGEKLAEHSEMKSAERVPPVFPNGVSVNCSSWNLEEKSPWESVGSVQNTGPHFLLTEEESTSSHLEMAPVSNHQDLDPKSTAAVVIQRRWRKYRQKCGNISSPPTAEEEGGRGGDEGKPEWRPSCVDKSAVGRDYSASIIQASWRGFTLRRRLASALAAVMSADCGEDGAFEEVDVDGFDFDEPPALLPDPPQYTLPPTPVCSPKQAWMAVEQMDSSGQRVSPDSSNRSKSASASVLSGLSARSEQILEEWGFSDSKTALLMLKRAQKMRSKKPQQNKHRDPSDCPALFRNQRSSVEARNRPAPPNRCHMKVFEAELGPQPGEQVKRERAQQWLRSQSDRDSESKRFLPEISSVILNGGRVQLVADPGYTEHLHHASGLWASSSSSSSAAQPSKESNGPHRNSVGRARKDFPSPEPTKSAPSKKERISFRDNPVQRSGGWGGGRKRDNVNK